MNFLRQEETWGLVPICGAFQHLYGILEHDLQILLDLESSKEREIYKIKGKGDSKQAKMDIAESIRKYLDWNLFLL